MTVRFSASETKLLDFRRRIFAFAKILPSSCRSDASRETEGGPEAEENKLQKSWKLPS
jgi:hypothetical protein